MALAWGDVLNIRRDVILIMAMSAPLLLAFVLRTGLPFSAALLQEQFNFELAPHYPFIAGLLILFSPMMIGMLVGFLLLDEKDEQILIYLSVTPLMQRGYIAYRLAVPLLPGVLLSYVMLFLLSDLVEFQPLAVLPVVLVASLGAPLIALLLGTVAGNKVEGLALSKIIAIVLWAPFAGYLLASPWRMIAGIVPHYWIPQAYLAGLAGDSTAYWLYLGAGLFTHLGYLFLLLKRFR